MKKLTKCQQSKCAYLQMGVGCRACKSCQAEPYLVDTNCYLCWNCEHDEGLLRWDVEDKDLDIVIAQIKAKKEKKEQENKPIEVKAE